MQLVNIGNIGRKIYLFIRHDNGDMEIKEDNSFFPFYYEEHSDGDFISYNGKPLKKIFVSKPSDIKKQASYDAWESDIKFPVRYLIDKIDVIEKTKIKYSFIDIETLSKALPNPLKAPDPVSCISSSNSFTDKISTFYLGDYDSEYNMIEAFIKHLKEEHYDLMLGWNFESFDYPYLYTRFPEFAQRISPEKIIANNSFYKGRYIQNDILYPIGTSIVDYMLLDKKYTLNRKREYSLNVRLFETINREKQIKKLDFSKLSPELKQRNINDVRDMMLMEKKLQYIPMLDGIRRVSKTQWEDYLYNSRSIDNLLLTAAKAKKTILPNKPKKEDNPEDFEGAFREAFKKGRFFNYGCYDLSGAYLNTILEFSLDPSNVYNEKVDNSIPINVTDRVTNKIITTYYVKQNLNLLLPTVANTLLIEKNKFKELKNNTHPNLPEYKDIEEKYKAWKGLSLSCWGVIGNKYFRYYNAPTASMITSIVRDLLHYVMDELKILGYEIIYLDTDGLILDDKGENKVDLLNELIQKWSQDRYKRNTKISFDYEGNYEKLFIVALTRYKGYLRRPDGTLEEKIIGIEAKRKNSTVFIKYFQTELLEKIMNNEPKENIVTWVKNEINNLSNKPLHEIAFPAKLADKVYKNTPIFKRALDNTADFNKETGNLFYWIYVKPQGYDTDVVEKELIQTYDKNGKEKGFKNITDTRRQKACFLNKIDTPEIELDKKQLKEKGLYKKSIIEVQGKTRDVLAFDEDIFNHIDKTQINWNKMIKLNIINKIEVIFEALNWDMVELGFIDKKPIRKIPKTPPKTTKTGSN